MYYKKRIYWCEGDMVGWFTWLIEKFFTSSQDDSIPEVVFLSDVHDWIIKRVQLIQPISTQVRAADSPNQTLLNAKHLRTLITVSEELTSLDSQKQNKKSQLDISQQRLHILSAQKDEKEIALLKLKDSPDFQELSDTFEKEKVLLLKREELDDELFLFLVRIKTALGELQDFNSNYDLLNVMKFVTQVQENFPLFFEDETYNELSVRLRSVNDRLNSHELREKDDGQYLYSTLFETFKSGNFVRKREERISCKNELDIHKNLRLRKTIFSKIEDFQYRIDHFTEQQEALEMHCSTLSTELEEINVSLEKKKQMFETLAKNILNAKLSIALASSLGTS
jgi:hypothetical protein